MSASAEVSAEYFVRVSVEVSRLNSEVLVLSEKTSNLTHPGKTEGGRVKGMNEAL